MKPISVHVDEEDYEELKAIAARRGRPVAEVVREAMAEYVVRARPAGPSLLSLEPAEAGRQLGDWSRTELFEEMLHRPEEPTEAGDEEEVENGSTSP